VTNSDLKRRGWRTGLAIGLTVATLVTSSAYNLHRHDLHWFSDGLIVGLLYFVPIVVLAYTASLELPKRK
jgi:hypothetical protein